MRCASMPICRNCPSEEGMAPQKKRPGSAVAWPLTSGAPVAVRAPFASGSSARRSGRNPVAKIAASKGSAGDCLKATPVAVKLATSPRILIRPSRIASSVPMSMSGGRPSSAMCLERSLVGLRQSGRRERADGEADRGRVQKVGHAGRKPLLGGGKEKDRQSEKFAGDNINRAANRKAHVNPSFGEVECDLCAGIAVADDQHALSGERSRIAIDARVQDRAAELSPCPAMSANGDSRPIRSRQRRLARFASSCPPARAMSARRDAPLQPAR